MASEVLTERWTPLVVRELLCGSTRFNDLRRGVPLMSPALLSKRLKTLERAGVVAKPFDASLLVWDMHRNIELDALPARRVVVHFHLRGSSDGNSHFWLVLDAPNVDLCLTDPGHDIDVQVAGNVATLVDYWMGRTDFRKAVRTGDLEVHGSRTLVAALPSWFSRSNFAPVPMPPMPVS